MLQRDYGGRGRDRDEASMRFVSEGDLQGTIRTIDCHTVTAENHVARFRFEPTDVARGGELPSGMLRECALHKMGHMGPLYASGGGKYLIKCYAWDRPVARVAEPRIEYELLCLAWQRGVCTVPEPHASGYFSEGSLIAGDQGRYTYKAVVEERVGGASIEELLHARDHGGSEYHGLSVRDIARLSLQVAEAIVGMKSLGISHCCLSVDNVIVRGGVVNEAPSVVLTGFEHAMPIQPSSLADPVYGVDAVYSAPESFFCRIPANRVSLASDVWSLGAMITTMFVGSDAWSWGSGIRRRGKEPLSDYEMDCLEKVRREPIDIAKLTFNRECGTEADRELTRALGRIVEACTEYRAPNRIDVDELAGSLRDALMRVG